mmetsp:Transcript_26813/g.37424  ORF Transcript_26813/g.37424 Transcript_26813/m.37424 type:complete len:109 (+) Transcript_26813:379-705(+)
MSTECCQRALIMGVEKKVAVNLQPDEHQRPQLRGECEREEERSCWAKRNEKASVILPTYSYRWSSVVPATTRPCFSLLRLELPGVLVNFFQANLDHSAWNFPTLTIGS